MQAIQPTNKEINLAFPDYHPMWLIQSQNKTVSGQNFKLMREHMFQMTVEQCAAYLRVNRTTINRWEAESADIPFSAFELLRVVFESANFKMSANSWQGWFINSDGRLVSPDRGNLSFSPNDLSLIRETHQANAAYRMEIERLKSEVNQLCKEINDEKIVQISSKPVFKSLQEKAKAA